MLRRVVISCAGSKCPPPEFRDRCSESQEFGHADPPLQSAACVHFCLDTGTRPTLSRLTPGLRADGVVDGPVRDMRFGSVGRNGAHVSVEFAVATTTRKTKVSSLLCPARYHDKISQQSGYPTRCSYGEIQARLHIRRACGCCAVPLVTSLRFQYSLDDLTYYHTDIPAKPPMQLEPKTSLPSSNLVLNRTTTSVIVNGA